jgi:NDP-sugar pyrophosphorylase family protein
MCVAGPLALARSILEGSDAKDDEPFFVLNSDVIVAFEEHKILPKMIAFHKAHGKEGTMLVRRLTSPHLMPHIFLLLTSCCGAVVLWCCVQVTRVTDPSKYGVVVSDKTGKISAFIEKPKGKRKRKLRPAPCALRPAPHPLRFLCSPLHVLCCSVLWRADASFGDCINAGIYLFNKSILNRIQVIARFSLPSLFLCCLLLHHLCPALNAAVWCLVVWCGDVMCS